MPRDLLELAKRARKARSAIHLRRGWTPTQLAKNAVQQAGRVLRECAEALEEIAAPAQQADVVTLASPSMVGRMQALRERIKNDPGYGVALLQRAGIINERGELTERFGGEPAPDEYADMEREHMGDPIKQTGIYAQPAPAPSVEAQAAYELGWRIAAHWVNRGDLISAIGSEDYIKDRDAALKESQP